MRNLILSLLAFCFSTICLASDVLTDLSGNVDSTVFVYLSNGVTLTGTLVSVDAMGVTVLTPSGGGTTEIDSTAIKAYTAPGAKVHR